jgi:dTDP-L-rhamnose 4-epimerase
VHLAAETGTAQSLTESTRHTSVNVVGTSQMLDAFVRAGALPQHIILASSRAIYGEGAWRSREGEDFYPPPRSHERLERCAWDFDLKGVPAKALPHRAKHTFPNPSSIYGATKLAQEQIISAWASALNVQATILRFQNVYGPGQSPFNPYTGIINIFHRVAYNGGAIDIYEDGLIGRDFVFIDDVVKAIAAAVASPPVTSRLLDVGTGKATTILDAANHIAKLYNAPTPTISGRFRDGDIRWAVSDAQDLESELGIRCEVDFLAKGAQVVGEWLITNGYMG